MKSFISFLLLSFVLIIASPLLLISFVSYLTTYSLAVLIVWLTWFPKGKDILFVYSNSPNWQSYLEENVIPKISSRAFILNWSERSEWRWWKSSPVFVFNQLADSREFNPMGVVFKPFSFPKYFSFFQAFNNHKHGKEELLNETLQNFFNEIDLK